MKRHHNLVVFGLFLTLIFSLSSCQDVRIKNHGEWQKYFVDQGIQNACFELYDNNKEIAMYLDLKRCSERMTPGATFDIFNAMAALSTNAVLDEDYKLLIVDSVKNINDSLTLSEAFKYNNRPYFEKLASLTGAKFLQHALDTIQYGNKKIGLDTLSFYYNDSLLISADEMVGFVKRVYHGKLPAFDQRSIRLVRNLMLQESKPGEKLFYRYAAIKQKDSTLHWLVGFMEHIEHLKNPVTGKIENIPHPYFFAMNFTTLTNTKDWKEKSVTILKDILKANHTNE